MKKGTIRILSLVCILVLAACVAAPAFAEKAELRSTQAFLDYLDGKGIKYKNVTRTDKYETVEVTYRLDHFDSLTCKFFFKEDNEEVGLRIWDIIKVKASTSTALSTINGINKDYKFAKFVLDESDMTIQAELDVYIDADTCGRPVYDSMMSLFNITDTDEVAPKLKSLE